MYIGASITPTLNNKIGLSRSIATISAEYQLQNTSFFLSGSIDKVKLGIIFGNTIQFSCAYVHHVSNELDNSVELGFRYRIKTKQNDFIEIGSYVNVDAKKDMRFDFVPLSVGFKKLIR